MALNAARERITGLEAELETAAQRNFRCRDVLHFSVVEPYSISAETLGLCLWNSGHGSWCGCVQILGSGLNSGYSDPAGSLS